MHEDVALLQRYLATRDQQAFAELVRRHVDLVYSAARRQVRDDAAAQDVTQQVFALLAEKARTIRDGEAVAGWLLVTTRFVALNSIRSEQRRRRNEREAAVMQQQRPSAGEPAWQQVGPMLDELVGKLKREDRDALALRYFQGRSVADVAAAMGVSTDAAQKRVTRAIERLRDLFASRGVTTTADALGSVLMANALVAAPAALGTSVAGTALTTGSATAGGTGAGIKGALTIMALAKAKLAAASVAAVVLVGVTGTIAYQQLAAPGAKPRQVRVAGAPTQPATDAAWRERFEAVYRLAPDEVGKIVPPPWIPERLEFHRDRISDTTTTGATALRIAQDRNGRLRLTATRIGWGGDDGGGFTVGEIASNVLDVTPQEIDLPHALMRTVVRGDLVYRADPPPYEQRLAALARILEPIAGRKIELVRRSQEREVIVVRGKLEPRPIPGAGTDRGGRFAVHLFVHEPDALPDGVGGGGGAVRHALNEISDITGYPVIIETPSVDRPLSYRQHDSVVKMAHERNGPADPAEVDALLANVAKQTSLELKRERRVIPMWVPAEGK